MINPSEHVYDDDPNRGHPDVRTRLKDVSYFFLGNGLIQAAVQWAPAGEGTALGLLVIDPDRLRKKREALTMDADRGLERTMVGVGIGGAWHEPTAGATRVRWTTRDGVPAVEAVWSWTGGETAETFFWAVFDSPRLAREVCVRCGAPDGAVRIRAAAGSRTILADADAGGRPTSFVYRFFPGTKRVELSAEPVSVTAAARDRWAKAARSPPCFEDVARAAWQGRRVPVGGSHFGHRADGLEHLAVRPGVGSRPGIRCDWPHDGRQSGCGGACCSAASFESSSRQRVQRAMDSSEVRSSDEAELNQNGVLLHALEQYTVLDGRRVEMIAEHWACIAAVAEYPLRPELAHQESGLLVNSREFWERHRVHGIAPGMELAHQVFVPIGLRAAARLAVAMRQPEQAARWASHADACGRRRCRVRDTASSATAPW